VDWRGAFAETTEDYEELLYAAVAARSGIGGVDRGDGLPAVVSAAQTVYPAARHQLCLAHWFRHLEALTPRFPWFQRRKFRREFWWIWDAENEVQARQWARRFCARWSLRGSGDGPEVSANGIRCWPSSLSQHRGDTGLRTTNLGEGWFQTLTPLLEPLPLCRNAEHSEQVLGLLPARRRTDATAKEPHDPKHPKFHLSTEMLDSALKFRSPDIPLKSAKIGFFESGVRTLNCSAFRIGGDRTC